MKKVIVFLLVIIFLLFFLLGLPAQYNIFDVAAIRRSQLEVRELSLYQKMKYDINRDFKVDEKDLNIIRSYIMNE